MGQAKTVLWVRNSAAFGGVETSMLGWQDHLDQDRFRCPTALFRNRDRREDAYRKPFEAHGHEILDLPWWPGRQFSRAVDTLERLIRETGAELLHTHDWRSDVVGYYAAKRAGIPILTTIYVWFKRPLKIYVSEMIDSWYIRHFDLVTAICEATRRQCVERGVPLERTALLMSGLSDERFREAVDRNSVRARFGIADHEIAFVYVARLYPEKAHLCLLDALKAAVARDARIKLVLLGTGPLEGKIRRHADRLGIADRVVLPGFVADVPEVLAAMDVTVHASLAEGIPMAIYESMMAGLAVIGSAVDGTTELVIPDKTGWLVPPRDRGALAEAMVTAAGRPDLRKCYGANGRELIRTQYHIDVAVEMLHGVYDRLLSRRMQHTVRPAYA